MPSLRVDRRIPLLARYFSLWYNLQARVLATPVFGAKGKPEPPPQVDKQGEMTSHLNGMASQT
jgi:hypothetical protein